MWEYLRINLGISFSRFHMYAYNMLSYYVSSLSTSVLPESRLPSPISEVRKWFILAMLELKVHSSTIDGYSIESLGYLYPIGYTLWALLRQGEVEWSRKGQYVVLLAF